jgi:hypothetical protein
MLLAIDPGANQGWALFEDRKLIACGLGDPKTCDLHRIDRIAGVLIEKPIIYPGRKGKARPADIITLAVSAGETGGQYRQWPGIEVSYVFPYEWIGGSVRKEVNQPRILRALLPEERQVLDSCFANGGYRGRPMAKGKRHNVIDAVGIGLFGVNRK